MWSTRDFTTMAFNIANYVIGRCGGKGKFLPSRYYSFLAHYESYYYTIKIDCTITRFRHFLGSWFDRIRRERRQRQKIDSYINKHRKLKAIRFFVWNLLTSSLPCKHLHYKVYKMNNWLCHCYWTLISIYLFS